MVKIIWRGAAPEDEAKWREIAAGCYVAGAEPEVEMIREGDGWRVHSASPWHPGGAYKRGDTFENDTQMEGPLTEALRAAGLPVR